MVACGCKVKSGDLKHEIVIQQRDAVRRSGGGQLVTWDTVATVFAMITPRNTNAYLRALYPSAKTIHKITIRYRDDIAVNMRIQYGVRYFNIVSIINDDEADKWLMIDAIETAEAAA